MSIVAQADMVKLSDGVVDLDIAERMEEVLDHDNVCKFPKSPRYIEIMQKVQKALIVIDGDEGVYSDNKGQGIYLEDYDSLCQLIIDCTGLSFDIDDEILIIHNFVRDSYRLKFPELESLVCPPVLYAQVVKKIGNQMDVTLVDLEGLLSSDTIGAVSVKASTTSGKPLPQDDLYKTLEACDRALALNSAKKKLLDFAETRMGYIAPNLSAIVGNVVAAKLMTAAGGLSRLSKKTFYDVELLGVRRNKLSRFYPGFHHVGGYIEQSEIVQTTRHNLQLQAKRLLVLKSMLAARVDSTIGDPAGDYGRSLKDEIVKRIENWKNPLRGPTGGHIQRKRKDRPSIASVQKLANKMLYGQVGSIGAPTISIKHTS